MRFFFFAKNVCKGIDKVKITLAGLNTFGTRNRAFWGTKSSEMGLNLGLDFVIGLGSAKSSFR